MMRMPPTTTTAALLLLLEACSTKGGGRNSDGTTGNGSAATVGSSPACLNLVNGVTTSDYPAVVRLLSQPDASHVGICTGTFISPTAVITAAHCVDGSDNGGLTLVGGASVNFNSGGNPFAGGVKALKAFTLGAIGETGNPNDPTVTSKDTAIVLFPPNSASAYMAIGGSLPAVGSTVTSIGYGLTTLSNATADPNYNASKHSGTTKIVAPQDTLNVYVGGVTAQQSAAAGGTSVIDSFGDSGGPLIFNNTVVATLSNGGDGPDAAGNDIWYVTFVDINSAQTKKLVALANQNGANIPAPGTPAAAIAANSATAAGSAGTCQSAAK